jgi:hypothetical protein
VDQEGYITALVKAANTAAIPVVVLLQPCATIVTSTFHNEADAVVNM